MLWEMSVSYSTIHPPLFVHIITEFVNKKPEINFIVRKPIHTSLKKCQQQDF